MSERGPLDFGDDAAPSGDGPRASHERPTAPPPARPGSSRYAWFLGVVAFLLIVVAILNGLGSRGVETGGPSANARMRPFAVPYASRAPTKSDDANVAAEAGQGEAGDVAACDVRGPQILNVCQLWERGPVVLALFPTEAGRCRSVLGQLERLRERFPHVQFAAVGSEGDRDLLRGGWSFPVGWDKDRSVAAIYGLVSCPQITFARRGGKVVETTRSELTDAALERRIRRLGS